MGGERCPEDFTFPSCLRACLDYFGQSLGCKWICAHDTTWRLDNTYTYLMGVSGCAFRFSWRPGWNSGDPAGDFLPAVASTGCGLDMVGAQGSRDEDLYRAVILHSLLEMNCPVIAIGVIGPPEACLITGFDEGGDVLIGWNYFQDFPEFNQGVAFEPTGEFRKRDWFANTRSLLVFRDSRPSLFTPERCTAALRSAVQTMLASPMPGETGDEIHGISAYQAWADDLLVDDAFSSADMSPLRQRFLAHDDAVGAVAEGRWYGAKFLEWVAEHEPAMEEELLAAAACFETEHDLMWQIWGQVGGNIRSVENVRKLADPLTRRAVVPLILQARDQDAEAAAHIERALEMGKARSN